MNKTIFILLLVVYGTHLLLAQASADFVTTWKTDMPGVSGPTQLTIPTFPGETYNYDVDWDNDGVFDSLGVSGSITHDYGTADTVTIRIRGAFPRIYFSFGGDREKILNIDQWGAIKWTSMYEAFGGCTWLNSNATDAPDLSGVASLESMFYECKLFNGDVSGWDVSKVSNMSFMFSATDVFNQDISAWNVSKVESFQYMFRNALSFDQDLGDWDISFLSNAYNMFTGSGLSVAHYDSLLIGWSTLDPGELKIPLNVTFHNSNLRYCAGTAARQKLLDDYGWMIQDGGQYCATPQDFVTTWKTNNPGVSGPTQVTIPTFPGEAYHYDVDWDNDGVFDTLGVSGTITHDYGAPDTVTIRIRGTFPRIYFNDFFTTDHDKLLSIEQWGDIAWTSMESAFKNCQYLNITNPMAGAPDLSQVTSTAEMFEGCAAFNASIDTWDVSTVTNMRRMFSYATAFNQDLDNWDVGQVTDMGYMFRGATDFNGSIIGWDVGQVQDMEYMFAGAQSFDQNLGAWDVSKVVNMYLMFDDASLSTANYDSLLLGWSQRPLQSNVKFSAGNSRYCIGAAARQALIDNFGWTITDGGLECVVGTDNLSQPDALLVFPNPTSGLLTIQPGKYGDSELVQLFDQGARCILSRTTDQQELLQLDISMFPAGLYTVQITGKSGSTQARVVKQ